MHVVVVDWLSVKETVADELDKQLRIEENHDCSYKGTTPLLSLVNFIQTNPVNTDTERGIESVNINRVNLEKTQGLSFLNCP